VLSALPAGGGIRPRNAAPYGSDCWTDSGCGSMPSTVSSHRDSIRVSRTNRPWDRSGTTSPLDSLMQNVEPSMRVTGLQAPWPGGRSPEDHGSVIEEARPGQ